MSQSNLETEDFYTEMKDSLFIDVDLLGKLVYDKIYDWYDGPMLFTVTNQNNQSFMVYSVEDKRDVKIMVYVACEIPTEHSSNLRKHLESITLNDYIRSLNNFFIISLKYSGEAETVSKTSIEEMKKLDYLFLEGIGLDFGSIDIKK